MAGFLNKRNFNLKEAVVEESFQGRNEAGNDWVNKEKFATYRYQVFGP
jgi:hypothetical protein